MLKDGGDTVAQAEQLKRELDELDPHTSSSPAAAGAPSGSTLRASSQLTAAATPRARLHSARPTQLPRVSSAVPAERRASSAHPSSRFNELPPRELASPRLTSPRPSTTAAASAMQAALHDAQMVSLALLPPIAAGPSGKASLREGRFVPLSRRGSIVSELRRRHSALLPTVVARLTPAHTRRRGHWDAPVWSRNGFGDL
jgi:hypothetical protein